jgi:hypothetical protein
MNPRLEAILFPENKRIVGILILFDLALPLVLFDRTPIWEANWWLIDDHGIFSFLGNRDHLPLSELFSTILTKTEVCCVSVVRVSTN